ncbi:MAG TPA: GNAT family protein [Candidatus Saccharimonadales bacterium]|nr:GNAT family protein [Candidatus Saccharimonadales bacterium]
MSDPELYVVRADCELGGQIDTCALMESSGFTHEDMESHMPALYLVEKSIPDAPALGYVACLDIKNGISHMDPAANGLQAMLGRLFVLPAYRRQGHATRLVTELTDTLFTTRRVAACVANCYPPGAAIAEKAGYEALPVARQRQRVAYRMTRDRWWQVQALES